MRPRYAWVLSGRHPTPALLAEARPRAEFEVFLARYGGTLLSCTTLGSGACWSSRILHRAGWPRMALAHLVQSRAATFDAIITSGEDIGVPIALAALPRMARTPIHMMFHGHHLNSPRLLLAAQALRRMPHVHFHCLSQALRERTMAVLGIPATRCHATGYGVDTDFFDGVDKGQERMIASAGAANRDYATLAAAVAGLPVEVRIAADSTWVPPRASAAPAGWPDNVQTRSYGSYVHLRELYGRSEFVVVPLHPARHACGYAVIAEALAMGRAVIATRTDAPPDFLQNEVTGLFVPAHDVAALRGAIVRLLDEPALAARLGQQAWALMRAEHGLERYCARLEQIITKSISSNLQGQQQPSD